jgi:hypothetical protein
MAFPWLFAASAATSVLSGILGGKAASTKGKAAKAQLKLEKQAAQNRREAIKAELEAAKQARDLEYKSAQYDIEATGYQAQSVIASTGYNVFKVLMEAENDARNYEASANAAEFNARIKKTQGKHAKLAAEENARQFSLRGKQMVAGTKALQAASGLQAEGSPLLVEEALYGEVAFGKKLLQSAGEREKWQADSEADLLNYYALNDRKSAELARTMGKISADYTKEAGKIGLNSTYMGYKTASLKVEAANLAATTAAKKAAIENKNSALQYKAAQQSAKYAQKSAKTEQYASYVSGFSSGLTTLANSGKWG